MPSNHLILCRPLLLLPSIYPSIRVFLNELALSIRWSNYWSFSFSCSNEYSGLISFRIDWFDLLAVQGTLQESSPTSPFKSISSSALSFLYAPTCTSIHDYWKSHSFGYGLTIVFEQSLLLALLCHLVIETALDPHVPKVKGRDMSATVQMPWLSGPSLPLCLLNLHLPLHSPPLSPSVI